MSTRSLGTRWASEAGGALVELAVALPLLVVIIAGTVDFGRVFYLSVSLTNAARAGALYGAFDIGRSGDTSSTGGIVTAAKNSIPNVSGVAATASQTCKCATDAGVLSNTSTSTCTGTCSAGQHVVVTVTVTATKTFTTIMNILPGVPSSINLTRAASMRVVN